MERSQWTDLPLFPLNTVLFPGMVLPLHIFEERYKLMVNRCLEEELPFGVLLIREGREVGEQAVPHEVGTTTVIAGATRLDGGQLNIVTIGHERFRLRSIRYDQPYLVGDAEPWPLGRRIHFRINPSVLQQSRPLAMAFFIHECMDEKVRGAAP